jgi:hypothetical protein
MESIQQGFLYTDWSFPLRLLRDKDEIELKEFGDL